MAHSMDKHLTKRSGNVYEDKRTVSRQFVELTASLKTVERYVRRRAARILRLAEVSAPP